MINTAIVEGIVFGEFRQKVMENGGLLVRFNLRCLMSNYRDSTGKYASVVVPCLAWNEKGQHVLKYLKADDRVIVQGTIGSYFRKGPRGGTKLENYVIIDRFSTTDPFNLNQYEIVPIVEKVVKDDTLKVDALEGWENHVNVPDD